MIVWKVLDTQYFDGGYWKKLGDDISLVKRKIIAERGNIYTYDGRMLATTIPTFNLFMDTKAEGLKEELWNQKIDSLAWALSTKFKDKSAAQWKEELTDARESGKRYYPIAKKISFLDFKQIKSFPIFNLSKNKSGLIVEQENSRKMPFGFLAQRTIGYIRDSGKYKVGIEGRYNEELTGENKELLMQKVAGGIFMPVNEQSEFGAKPGLDIVTTLDINLQDLAESSLERTLKKFQAKHGSVILMNIKTGEIKAIANLGKFKPKDANEVKYIEDYNYAIGEPNEPGSVIKLASVMALLEDGFCDENYKIDLSKGRYKYYNAEMIDAHPKDATVTLKEAFKMSSNVGISKPIFKFYSADKDKFYAKLEQFNLTKPIGIEIVGEVAPQIKKPKEWTGVSLPWMSIGYEMKLTPLQILTFYAAVANEGKMMKPYLVKEVRDNSNVLETFKPEVISDRIAKKETISAVKKMLENVVDSGTASNIKSYYSIAGKTGTNLLTTRKNGYKEKYYQASFVGYFPAENPLYACIVVVNSPNNSIGFYGNVVAAPVFKDIADRIYATDIKIHKELLQKSPIASLGIKTFKGFKEDIISIGKNLGWNTIMGNSSFEWGTAVVSKKNVVLKPTFSNSKLMPNLKDMSVKDAVYILENMGARVTVQGKGKITDQSIKPGEKIFKGSYVKIYLG
jgi:cell division protein FtsI (penicillin-binding protein 3)